MLGRWFNPVADRVRPLRGEDSEAALELCATDPVANVLAAIQVEQLGRRRMPGAEVLGLFRDSTLRALYWSGANLVPVAVDTPDLLDTVSSDIRSRARRASSIVGPAEQVTDAFALNVVVFDDEQAAHAGGEALFHLVQRLGELVA